MRVSYNVERLGARGPCRNGAVFDQCPTNALSPCAWLDEKRIQLRVAVFAWKNGGEPHHRTGNLSDENASSFNLFKRQFNRVGMGQERIAISGVVERSTPLKRFKLLLF